MCLIQIKLINSMSVSENKFKASMSINTVRDIWHLLCLQNTGLKYARHASLFPNLEVLSV